MRPLDPTTWLVAVGAASTDTTVTRREKSVTGEKAQALAARLAAAPATAGSLLRCMYRRGHVGITALTGDHAARGVQRRFSRAWP